MNIPDAWIEHQNEEIDPEPLQPNEDDPMNTEQRDTHIGRQLGETVEHYLARLPSTNPKPIINEVINLIVGANSNASHLNQVASDTAYPKQFVDDPLQATQSQRDKFDKEVVAYWKSKQGFCLACNLPIALEDSYCGSCHEFLLEVHTQTPNPLT